MPELPEVETIKSSLAVNIGARIAGVELRRDDIVRRGDYPVDKLPGRKIENITRRGKFIILVLDEGYYLIAHLGMSGRLYMMETKSEIVERHVHFVLYLDNDRKIVYQDARRFGGIWFCLDIDSFFNRMGPEPLSRNFSVSYLAGITANRKIAIKSLLLNQQLVCGIGNIYADEALFLAGIRPDRPAASLDSREIADLHRAVRKVLKQSIAERGTTFRDYRDGYNQSGSFQNSLKVYGKTNQPCVKCGNILVLQRIGGRSSHFCQH